MSGRWHARHLLRWGGLIAVAFGAAACSQDTTRFGPYAAPTPPSQVAAAPPPAAPASRIERQPLPQSQYVPPAAPPTTLRGPDITGALPPTPSGGSWAVEGGTPVVVAQGDTVYGIAHRYHVPATAVIEANRIANPATIRPGQQLVIPRYVTNGPGAALAHAAAPRHPGVATAAPPVTTPPATAPVMARAPTAPAAVQASAAAPTAAKPPMAAQTAASGSGQTLLPTAPTHVVASGDTLSRIAHKYHVKLQELAVANGLQPTTPLKIGMQLAIPVNSPVAKPAPVATAAAPPGKLPAPAKAPAPAGPGKLANVTDSAHVVTVGPEAATEVVAAAPPAFRWPLRGRVTGLFGAKTSAGANGGIDLSVPEGTPVRAADDGVVAYAGNELKDYGNLVLVRHDNGYVTAYANASEIMVKRNDQVHRGQVIAKSGQTGSATAPQLHFEIRKNSQPVDPMQFLPSDKTASAPL